MKLYMNYLLKNRDYGVEKIMIEWLMIFPIIVISFGVIIAFKEVINQLNDEKSIDIKEVQCDCLFSPECDYYDSGICVIKVKELKK